MNRVDQQLPRSFAPETHEFVGVNDNDGIVPMQRDVLRAFTVCPSHQFAKARFCVLKAPVATKRLKGFFCPGMLFSGHGD